MANSSVKTKAIKFHPFELINQWGVTATHGISIIHNCQDVEMPWQEKSSLDVEDDEEGNFAGIGIYNSKANACYYWSDWELASQLTIPKFIAHNGISDIRKLQKWGFKLDESWLIWDTQLMGHILDSSLRTYGLKDMVKRDLGFEYPSYEAICGKKGNKGHKTLKDFPAEHVAEYNSCDTLYCYRLYEKQRNLIEKR
jgi:DNA polymerase I-like protein with 3'-5' exonuclease and polymerase domains